MIIPKLAIPSDIRSEYYNRTPANLYKQPHLSNRTNFPSADIIR
jgi:hypothetical protein